MEEGIFELGMVVFLFFLGLIGGTINEKRHYKSIRRREELFLQQPSITLDKRFEPEQPVERVGMVYGSAVISIDYFKLIVAALIKIFGGRVTVYESLLDRARREALLRMKEQAPDADIIINVRIETSSISKGTQEHAVGTMEALAYGTCVYYRK